MTLPQSLAPWRVLPDQPNLEQLKKQAKDLLRDFRAGDADAVAEIHRVDSLARADALSLATAQHVLARAYGFESWAQLKERVEGRLVTRFCDAAKTGDVARLREMIRVRPDLVGIDLAANDEHRAIHFAVEHRHPEAVRVLMDAGSDARKGIYPKREATTPLAIATDRGYNEIVAIIELAEQVRRENASCPNVTVSPEQDQINAAIKASRNEEAIAILSSDESLIRACDRDGATPLHVAAEVGNDAMVAWLLARRASVTKTDLRNRTPLDRAVFSVDSRNKGSLDRFPAVAQRLRNAGAPLTLPAAVAMDDRERVMQLHRDEPALCRPGLFPVGPLGIAVRHRQHEMIRLLLDLGVDVNDRHHVDGLEEPEFTTGDPLWHAVVGDDYAAAVLLLDRGADPNATIYASGTPIAQAFGTRNVRLQKLLTDRGGKLDPEYVGLYRQTDRARRLLDGTEPIVVDTKAYSGPTLVEQLLWGAACGGDAEIVRVALHQIDWPRDDARWYRMAVEPLRLWNHGTGHWAGGYDRSTYTNCFRQIVARCDVNAFSRQGATLLHRVASDGATMTADERLTFATILLEAGARFDARDDILKSTPLAWAARWGCKEMVELYLSRGCSVEEPNAEPWATPLAWAKRYKRDEIVRLIEMARGTVRPVQ